MSSTVRPYRLELSPVRFLERSGVVFADRTAVVDGAASYTWREVRDRSRQFASALISDGLERGQRVAFLALNSEPLLLSHFAVPQAGGVLVAINTQYSAEEVARVVQHSGAVKIFYSAELEASTKGIGREVARVALGAQFEAVVSSGSPAIPTAVIDSEDDLIALDYTSGTTGAPKGVMYDHRGAYLNALAMVIENRLTPDSTYLWTLPMFHCNGWSHTWALAAAGACSICLPRVDPSAIWKLLAEVQVTHFSAAPTVLIMLANDPAAHRLRRRVRVCTGGAPPSPNLIAAMESFNIELVHLYGLTETYGPATMSVPPTGQTSTWSAVELAAYTARQGFQHVVGMDVQVVDEEMQPLPSDGASLGEVVLRGNTVTRGYYGDPDLTAEVFRGGWLHTGDLGVTHPDGSLELKDRKKDIIISGGENIPTIEVEQAVMSHPAVLEAAVIGVPDAKWGEVPKAFVELRPQADLSEQEIIDHVRARIAHFKAPRTIEFGLLPRTSTGKVQKHLLRERAWSSRDRRIN
jgi:fatty-acyl-CoA synthase